VARPVVGAYASAPTTGCRAGGLVSESNERERRAKRRRERSRNRQNSSFRVIRRLVAGAEVVSFDLEKRDDEP
jgi:hypothetical protein